MTTLLHGALVAVLIVWLSAFATTLVDARFARRRAVRRERLRWRE